MHSNAFLNTAGSIMSKNRISSNSNPKSKKNFLVKPKISITNTSNFMSTAMNNRSITTNESSFMNNNSRSFNPKIRKFIPLQTTGTDKSTWYHTKTVASIMREKQKELNMADEIMKERQRQGLGGGIGNNNRRRGKVLEKSREICLDNYMITQLRQKRTEISKKEFFVEEALKLSEKQYEKDYRAFIDFIGDIKKKKKKKKKF